MSIGTEHIVYTRYDLKSEDKGTTGRVTCGLFSSVVLGSSAWIPDRELAKTAIEDTSTKPEAAISRRLCKG